MEVGKGKRTDFALRVLVLVMEERIGWADFRRWEVWVGLEVGLVGLGLEEGWFWLEPVSLPLFQSFSASFLPLLLACLTIFLTLSTSFVIS